MVAVHVAHLTARLRIGCGVHLSNSMGTPQDVMVEQLAWLGKEVLPAFTSADVGVAAGAGLAIRPRVGGVRAIHTRSP